MANFTRVKAAGWSLNEVLTSAQMNQLDIDHAASVNGDGGGSWAGAITWTGAQTYQGGITLSSTLQLVSGGKIQVSEGTLGDADATLYSDTRWFRFTVAPTVARTYTLNRTGGTAAQQPVDGQPIDVTMTISSALNAAIFEDQGGTEMARINTGSGGAVQFRYSATATAWKCTGVSGSGVMTIPH